MRRSKVLIFIAEFHVLLGGKGRIEMRTFRSPPHPDLVSPIKDPSNPFNLTLRSRARNANLFSLSSSLYLVSFCLRFFHTNDR